MRFWAHSIAAVFSLSMMGARGGSVVGRIAWNDACPSLPELKPHTTVVLDGGAYTAGVRRSGEFSFEDVADGAYVLSVLAPDHVFDFVRVDVENETVSARAHILGTPFEVSSAVLAYPLALSARGRNSYFAPREGFNLAGMLQNPMMLLMVGSGVLMLFMPKLMESMGDEMKQEIEQKRQEMLGTGAGPGSGLPRDLDVGDARAGLAGGVKSGKGGRRKK